MTGKREQHHSGKSKRGPKRVSVEPTPETLLPLEEPRGVQKGIADTDKISRTGSTKEDVRDTPPAGAWNETSGD